MKAVRVNQWGQPVQIEDIPQPTPGNDEVLVRVRAASINPVDGAIVAGYMQSMLSVPMTLGADFAGEVDTVGRDVNHVQPGDAVYGMSSHYGTFAQYAAVKANGVARKPQSLDYVQAAAVPLAALSAWQMLFHLAKLQSGERILIHGAAGGIGVFAVQLAKEKGAYVIGSDKANKQELLEELGTDQILDALGQRFEDVVGHVDVVLDLVGGDLIQRSFSVLKRGGRYVTPAGQPSQEEAEKRGIEAYSTYTQPTVEDLTQIAQRIDAGKLKVFVSRTYPLAEIQEALTFKQEGATQGKIGLVID